VELIAHILDEGSWRSLIEDVIEELDLFGRIDGQTICLIDRATPHADVVKPDFQVVARLLSTGKTDELLGMVVFRAIHVSPERSSVFKTTQLHFWEMVS
jgi:hypothetical protein